jgi:hypothetical protein
MLPYLLLLLLLSTCISGLQVHIIAHSHCDPGWLETFEGYYANQVNNILNQVTTHLATTPSRRFVWAETSFLSRWFDRLGADQRQRVRELLRSGRLEIVGGGWVQHDEANPDLFAILNQNWVGHQYLQRNFGVQPRIAWQIDPFGHSSVTPSVFKKMGYEALVINRIHHRIKAGLKQDANMEFVWNGTEFGCHDGCSLFTHVLHTHYSAPRGFDWEEGAEVIQTSRLEFRAREFVNIMLERAKAYKTTHLLVPFGDDFKFQNAEKQFTNMEMLIGNFDFFFFIRDWWN